LGSSARNWGDVDQVIATLTLDFAAGKSLVAKKALLAMGTLKFEFSHMD